MTTARPADQSLVERHLTGEFCDRCGAHAKVATQVAGTVLIWCAHHFRDHAVVLLAKGGIVLVDNRTPDEKRPPGSRS